MSAIDCFVAAGVRGGDIRKVSVTDEANSESPRSTSDSHFRPNELALSATTGRSRWHR